MAQSEQVAQHLLGGALGAWAVGHEVLEAIEGEAATDGDEEQQGGGALDVGR
jgi:hypothetical protein